MSERESGAAAKMKARRDGERRECMREMARVCMQGGETPREGGEGEGEHKRWGGRREE